MTNLTYAQQWLIIGGLFLIFLIILWIITPGMLKRDIEEMNEEAQAYHENLERIIREVIAEEKVDKIKKEA